MEALRDSNSGFDYQLLEDTNGRYTGCIWQTSTMKEDFDSFGGFLSIDAMKCGINKLLWPYMYITLYNEINCVCVACEAIAKHVRYQLHMKNNVFIPLLQMV